MVKKIIISICLVAVVLGGGFYYFAGTPKYSLYQLKKAIGNHDSMTFNKYVDVDRVTGNLLDTASQSFDEEMKKEDNPFGEFGNSLLQSMIPALKEKMKSEINKGIEEISEDKDNKYAEIKIESVVKEGKSAKVSLKNSDNETIRLDMIQTPDRYWKIVGINFDDFKKISPDTLSEADAQNNDEKINQTIIDKNIGDEIELATMKFKINSADEKPSVKSSYGSAKSASEGSKFIVINLTVTNNTKEGFDFDSDGIRLTDNQDRKFDPWDDTIGSIDNYLEMRELQPSIPQTGFMIYEVPNDANSYRMNIGKRGTNEVYSISLK